MKCRWHICNQEVKNNNSFCSKKCSSKNAVQRRRTEVKIKAVEYKGGKCIDCGYNRCINVLQFHHLNPKEKEFNISRNGHSRSWDRVKAEIEKCVLLCANCHAERHYNEHKEIIGDSLNRVRDINFISDRISRRCKSCDGLISYNSRLNVDLCRKCYIKSIDPLKDYTDKYIIDLVKQKGISKVMKLLKTSHKNLKKRIG